tara:strand:- start:548 stop:1210 length:663 start_codon:yes stop_codon:yes gene_type:complete
MAEPKQRPLTRLQRQRRERILQAVRDQLESGGYSGVSMRDLAELAEVSPTTLYNLFDNKDTLIMAALTDLLDQLSNAAGQRMLSGIDRMLTNYQVTAAQIKASPHYAQAMTRMLFNAGPDDPVTRILLHDPIASTKQRVMEMQEDGDICGNIDVDLLARRISSSNWSVNMLWMKNLLHIDELAREYKRNLILILRPFMAPATARKYQSAVLGEAPLASAS